MSISTSCYFSNSLVGVPQVGADVDVYEVHSAPKFAVGTMFQRQDGCVFRYAHFGTAISSVGALVGPNVNNTNILPKAAGANIQAPSSTYQMEADPKGVYPSANGSRFIMMGTNGMASLSAHQLQGGYINISAGTGGGFTYRIKDNTASGDPAAGLIRLELYDKVRSASLDTTSTATIAGSKYADLALAAATTGAGIVAGATMATSSATLAWGWIQVRGLAGVKMDGLNVLAGSAGLLGPGKTAILSTGGAVTGTTAAEGLNAQFVGTVVTVSSAGNTGLISLLIE